MSTSNGNVVIAAGNGGGGVATAGNLIGVKDQSTTTGSDRKNRMIKMHLQEKRAIKAELLSSGFGDKTNSNNNHTNGNNDSSRHRSSVTPTSKQDTSQTKTSSQNKS